MKYSDFLHESEIKHRSISYDLLTPKVSKGKLPKRDKIKITPAKAIALLGPYTYVRIMEQIKQLFL